jgi:ABC-type bacteriocin/lantibiotic exporter with double-glycine peptidase domain
MAVLLVLVKMALPEIIRLGTTAIESRNLEALIKCGVLAVTVTVLTLAFNAFNVLLIRHTKNRGEQGIQLRLAEKMIEMKIPALRRYKAGEIITETVNNPMEGIGGSLESLCCWIGGISALILSMAYMGFLEWRLALCIAAYNALLRVAGIFVEPRLKRNSRKVIEAAKASNNLFLNFLVNNIPVRIYEKNSFFHNLLRTRERDTLKANLIRSAWNNGVMDLTWATAKFAEFTIIYGFGGWLVYRGVTGIGTLLSFVFASDILVNGIDSFIQSLTAKNAALAGIESIERFLETAETENETGVLDAPGPFAVRFENVSFGYGENSILENISFTINHGDKVLLRGPNGEGKSTLLYLLSGLYRPKSGRIYFGGQDIGAVNLESLVDAYRFIPQTAYILAGDVRENIALETSYPETALRDIMRDLNLEGAVSTAPDSLSQGEKKRVGIGRALYKKRGDLVLGDEIFANLDRDNIASVIPVLKNRFYNKTVVFVCHDPVDFPFNRIFTVGGGKLAEEAVP